MYYLIGDRRRFLRHDTFFIRYIKVSKLELNIQASLISYRKAKILDIFPHLRKVFLYFCTRFCTFYKTLFRTKNANTMTQSAVLLDISIFQQPERKRERERKRSGPDKHARPRISRVAKREGKYKSSRKMILHLQVISSLEYTMDLNEKNLRF